MKIPRLAKGGSIQDNMSFIPNIHTEPIIDILGKKYINIYERTKNRRIKKKQIKKCPMLKLKLGLTKYIDSSYCDKIVLRFESKVMQ